MKSLTPLGARGSHLRDQWEAHGKIFVGLFWLWFVFAFPACDAIGAPDLIVLNSAVSASPNPVTAGNNVTVGYTIKNVGNTAAVTSHTRVLIENQFGSFVVDGIYQTNALSVNGTVDESRSLSIPSTAGTGTYTIRVVLDVSFSDGVNQSNTTNDVATRTLSVVAAQPDLIISGLVTVNPSSITAGNNVTVSYTIRNQGSGNAGFTNTKIQIKDASLNTWYDSTHGTGSLGAGSTVLESETINIPSNAPGGTYTAYVILDVFNAINQSNTSNDQGNRPFTVIAPPEITVFGNGILISDGATNPLATNWTDFGTITQAQGGLSRQYMVRNDGGSTLTLGSVSVPSGFTLTEGLSPSLAPGASDTFTVRLDDAAPGIKSGQISFSNNDSNENPFNFSITGRVIAPEITVSGGGSNISDGDTTPNPSDGTDFGTAVQGQAGPNYSYTVRNDGDTTLTLGSVNVPSGFTVIEQLTSSLSAGFSDTFTVRLDTATLGTKSGQISFSNNDADETPFNFSITGTVLAAPEITVLGNGTSIADGDTTPGSADYTDFGSVIEGQTGITRTFTVRNDGGSTLTLNGLTAPSGFSITEGLSSNLAAGASDTFTVRLDGTTPGIKSGQISFANNDGDENPFNFSIMGTVMQADSDDQISEATPFGEIFLTFDQSGDIVSGLDVDMFSFTVAAGQRISFDIDLPSGSLNSHLRLFNSSGTQLAADNGGRGPGELESSESYIEYTFTSGGTYYVGVSGFPNSNYNAVDGSGDTAGTTPGAYKLVISPGLAGTIRKVGHPTDYAVDILRFEPNIGVSPTRIDPQLRTWIVVHGWRSSRYNTAGANIAALAAAISIQRPGEQVLTLDWSSAANTPLYDPCFAAAGIKPVAQWAEDALRSFGFVGGNLNNLNFVGHSFGSYVSAETAKLISGGVATIIGLDPAAHFPPCVYDPNSGVDKVDFRQVSQFSWAFHTSGYGSDITAATAARSFVIPHDYLVPSASDHARAANVFASMLSSLNGGVSQLFRLQRLLDHTPGPWCLDRYTSHAEPQGGAGEPGYDAIIEATPDDMYAESITYVMDCTTGKETFTVEIPDSTNPSITITNPTSDPVYESFPGVLALYGSASDNVRVKRVDWVNNRGGSGTAAGATNWVAGNIALQEGQNIITITARDVAGNTSSDVITVTYQPVNLTVLSANPDTGVSIAVAPSDITLQGGGTTTFTRRYEKTTSVTLIAPAALDCNDFVKWERDGADWSFAASTTITMDTAHSMRAVYVKRPPRAIYVDRNYSGGGSDGSQARPYLTVGAAYGVACDGDTLCIFGGSYPETFTNAGTIQKVLFMERWEKPQSGTVFIGQ